MATQLNNEYIKNRVEKEALYESVKSEVIKELDKYTASGGGVNYTDLAPVKLENITLSQINNEREVA
jgi:hypothetical protein